MPDQKPTLEYENPTTRRDDTLRSLHRFDRIAMYGLLAFVAIFTAFIVAVLIWIFTRS
jgi:hypothetical protein